MDGNIGVVTYVCSLYNMYSHLKNMMLISYNITLRNQGRTPCSKTNGVPLVLFTIVCCFCYLRP